MSISTSFRPLNEHETQAIVAARERGKIKPDSVLYLRLHRALVSYERMQGGFCVCVVMIPSTIKHGDLIEKGYVVYRGASCRSYKDPRKPIRGEMLAFSRAILYSRPVELS